MSGFRLIIWAGMAAAACAGADPVDANTRSCGSDAAVPAAFTDRYALLRAPARRGDALPRGADCQIGDLHTFARGVRLLARHGDGSRTYFMPVYDRRGADGYSGLSACIATLTPQIVRGKRRSRRVYNDVGGCSALPTGTQPMPSESWFHDGKRVVAVVPDGVARVRVRLTEKDADRELAVRRNVVVLDASPPLSWTWLAADGSVVAHDDAPFVCED